MDDLIPTLSASIAAGTLLLNYTVHNRTAPHFGLLRVCLAPLDIPVVVPPG